MVKKSPPQNDVELRRLAEERLVVKIKAGQPVGYMDDPLKLQHELQIHQVELEMQNAQLRQTRDDLEAALEQYTDLYEFAPTGYVTIDCNGTIGRVNLTGASLLREERFRLIGRRLENFVIDEARSTFSTFLVKVFESGGAKATCEIALLKKGEVPLQLQVEGVLAASGKECRVALIDLTERKLAEEVQRLANEAVETDRREEAAAEALRLVKEAAESLRVAKETAETIALAKSQFLVNMSHELRTPMTGILGMLQLALDEDSSPVLREFLETTQNSANSLLRILNDILDMAKFEAGKLIIEDKPFSLKECISQAVDFITPEVRRKGLNITFTVAKEVPDAVIGDQMRLRQVLINLVGNAVKFTDAGKVQVQVVAGSVLHDRKREFTFTVSDTGIGIPDDKKELLFRAFSQVDPSLSRKYGGTGLGLAISREIVELMGGTISFVSEEGGTVFSFNIHLKEAGSEHRALPAAVPLPPEALTAGDGARIAHILLAEDDSTIRQILGVMLKRANYTLDTADDGLKAIEMWELGGYDLVLMDIQMPRLNGFEATSIIRDQEQVRGGHIPIIAMTAHASKEDEKKCLDAGMDAYVSKPIDFGKALQMIRETLQKTSE
jgi:signal transduction histidine kinase/ActR/RegA family two-component response regulator